MCTKYTITTLYSIRYELNSIKVPNNLISTNKFIGDTKCQKTY